jgi:hypothetical protein
MSEPSGTASPIRCAESPITVPTVAIGSDFDGAAAHGRAYAEKFSGIESSKASDTMRPKKPRARLPTPSSKSEVDW